MNETYGRAPLRPSNPRWGAGLRAVLLGAATLSLWACERVDADVRAPQTPTHTLSCPGGESGKLAFELGPMPGEQAATGRTIDATLRLINDGEVSVHATINALFLDDLGHAVGIQTRPRGLDVAPGSTYDGVALSTPTGVADGYYQIRVTVTADDGDGAEVSERPIFLNASRGTYVVVAEDTWMLGARATEEEDLR